MILLLGGTLESRKLVTFLKTQGMPSLVSTFGQYGEFLAKEVSDSVQSGILDERKLEILCKEKKIRIIIDATHPYAVNISHTAITVAEKLKLFYLRYERNSTFLESDSPFIKLVKNSSEAAVLAEEIGTNILLTIGSRQLKCFESLLKNKKIFARVLPDLDSIEKCLQLGLKPSNIIAMQGPFSHEFNKLVLIEKKIDLVITKNSGSIGGTDTKLTACLELKIPIIIIDRPVINYPRVAYKLEDVNKILQEVYHGIHH